MPSADSRQTEIVLNQIIFDPPRWKGGPKICSFENLPAFDSEAELLTFLESVAMESRVKRKWRCEKCGCFHALCKAKSPSGSSSGTERK